MYTRRAISKNTFYIFVEKVIKMISYLFSGVVIARNVEPEIFGIYSSLLSLNVIFSAISALGLNSILIKKYVTSNYLNSVVSNALFVRFFSCLLFSLLSIPIAFALICSDLLVALLSSLIVVMSLTSVIDLFFESKLRNVVVAKYKVVGYIVGFCLKVFVAVYFKSTICLVAAHLIELLVIFSLSAFCFRFEFPNHIKTKLINRSYSTSLLKIGFPLFLSSIAGITYMKIDQLFVVYFLGGQSAGYYASAVRVCEGLFAFSAILLPSFFPYLINLYRSSLTLFNKAMKSLYFYLLGFGVLLASLIVIFSDRIIFLFYGDAYSSSSEVLVWFSLSIPVVYIGELFSRWLVISNNTYLSLQRHMLGLFVNVVLNYFLIPVYGIKGAAVASLISYIFSVLIFSVVSSRARRFYIFLK